MPVTPTPPATVADFKAQFKSRGFVFGEGPGHVMDSDVETAIVMATTMWNPCLWNATEAKTVFCLLVAHFLVWNIQAVGGLNKTPTGTPGGYSAAMQNTGGGVVDSKGAEKVWEKYAGLEALITKYPMLADLRRTDFGAQYALMLAPRLVGRVGIAPGPSASDAAVPAVPFLG